MHIIYKNLLKKNRDDLQEHTIRSMDKLFKFLYNKNDDGNCYNFIESY